jgi:osmoprotectant transport system ATP-binding protein
VGEARAPAIELFSVGKRYGDRSVVDGVSLRVEPGECVMLVGGSGGGKTTTLKLVNRLIEADSGRVEIAGEDVRSVPGPELRRRIGYGFQQVGLFPHLTVAENVGVTPELLGWDAPRVRARTDELLALLELPPDEFRDRWPGELSGGQAQRVGLARALAGGARVLLLDEPFGALDPATRDRLQDSFLRIRRELAPTTMFVTHDMAEALLLADRIAILRAGRLVQVATPADLLARPADEGVRELFLGPRRQAKALLALSGEAAP